MGLYQINASNFMSRHVFNHAGLFLQSAVSFTGLSSPINWGEFPEAGFSADVTTKRDCEAVYMSNESGELSNGVDVRNTMPDTVT